MQKQRSFGSDSPGSTGLGIANKVRRGDIRHAVVVRAKKEMQRKDGSVIRFDDNACVLINKSGDPIGTRITSTSAHPIVLARHSLTVLQASWEPNYEIGSGRRSCRLPLYMYRTEKTENRKIQICQRIGILPWRSIGTKTKRRLPMLDAVFCPPSTRFDDHIRRPGFPPTPRSNNSVHMIAGCADVILFLWSG